MSKTAIAFIAWLIICYILEWTAPKELDKKCPKVDKSEKPNNQKSLWEHPFLKSVGMTKPTKQELKILLAGVQVVDIEEVVLEDVPDVWQSVKDGKIDRPNQIILEIGNSKEITK